MDHRGKKFEHFLDDSQHFSDDDMHFDDSDILGPTIDVSDDADLDLETAYRHSLELNSINSYITCSLCNGYLVDATTVIDCLHTFCKSCLLKYFEGSNDCPKCHIMIHQSHPSHYVSFDRTIQDIVYQMQIKKIVPEMFVEEQRRRRLFQEKHKITDKFSELDLQPASNQDIKEFSDNECCSISDDVCLTHHRNDEPVLIHLVAEEDSNLEDIERTYIRVSVNTVKRLLAYLLFADLTRYTEIDIFCNNELMGRDYNMAFIQKTRWRNQTEPIKLTYKKSTFH